MPVDAGVLRVRPDVPASPPLEGVAAEERFRALVDEHYDFVWRSLRRLGVEPAEVDDAAGWVFWILCTKLGTVVVGCERTFLFRTALGVSANLRRAAQSLRRREVADSCLVEAAPDAAPTPEDLVRMKQARHALDGILDRMPMELRAVFVLAELEGMTVPSIAETLDIPTGTAASRLRRARETFHKAVARLHAKEKLGGLP